MKLLRIFNRVKSEIIAEIVALAVAVVGCVGMELFTCDVGL